jgi:phospho-N-acetylmuramoyl-pentapeptide-transferase
VIRVLAAGVVAMIVSIVVGPKFIAFLRKNEFGQHIREELPEAHRVKQGTPTMGGLLILVVATGAFLAVSKYKVPALTVLFVTLGCGAIGFLDDFIKLTHRRSLGLRGRWKLLGLALITVGVGFAAEHQQLPTSVFIPIVHWNLELSWGWYVLLFLVIAGTTNGVNLTDGLDGLAIGPTIVSASTFLILAYVAGTTIGGFSIAAYLRIPVIPGAAELGVFCSALMGAGIAFLWYNTYPASVFMGDVGSLALGGALGTLAVLVRQEILLAVVGGIFVVEAMSVIIQVASFQLRGKRVFLMAPIHHHFEKLGWQEPTIVIRFWIISVIFALAGLATLKLR